VHTSSIMLSGVRLTWVLRPDRRTGLVAASGKESQSLLYRYLCDARGGGGG
jgi:hypothetical protein